MKKEFLKYGRVICKLNLIKNRNNIIACLTIPSSVHNGYFNINDDIFSFEWFANWDIDVLFSELVCAIEMFIINIKNDARLLEELYEYLS